MAERMKKRDREKRKFRNRVAVTEKNEMRVLREPSFFKQVLCITECTT